MKRPARLQAARHWLAQFRQGGRPTGKRLVRMYAKWFGVDLGCALKELRLLGIAIDPEYAENLLNTLRNRPPRRRAAPPPEPDLGGYGVWWDDYYAYIAGRTSNGFAFGTTWEEAERMEEEYGAPFDDRALAFWEAWVDQGPELATPSEDSREATLAALEVFRVVCEHRDASRVEPVPRDPDRGARRV